MTQATITEKRNVFNYKFDANEPWDSSSYLIKLVAPRAFQLHRDWCASSRTRPGADWAEFLETARLAIKLLLPELILELISEKYRREMF